MALACADFFKVHLKHKELRWHRDRRLGDAKMSEPYDWTQLHHIHCVVRTFYTALSSTRKSMDRCSYGHQSMRKVERSSTLPICCLVRHCFYGSGASC